MGTSNVSTWLGQSESDVLEYKDAESLKHPETIVRAVVALLNSGDGRVIVGVGDDGVPRGVADPMRARDRLQQILDDRIEPRPIGKVNVVAVSVLPNVEVLEVNIARGDDPPYVERHQGRLGYWRRSGARAVPGNLADLLAQAKRRASPPTPQRPWTDGLTPERPTLIFETPLNVSWQKRELEGLWKSLSESRGELGRPFGWTVVPMNEPDSESYDAKSGLTIGRAPHGRSLRFERNGTIRFEAYEGLLVMPVLANMLPPANFHTLNPYMVVEGAASFARLVAAVAKRASEQNKSLPSEVLLTVGLWSLEGWHLPPKSILSSLLAQLGRAEHETIRAGAVAATHTTGLEALRNQPDLAARRLAGNLWEELGRSEDDLPFWDEASQVFRFG